jgi:hypothetical protein
MYFSVEKISNVVSKKSEKIFSIPHLRPRVKMIQKSKFLGFFRNHARNVIHFEPKEGETPNYNGVEESECCSCLMGHPVMLDLKGNLDKW